MPPGTNIELPTNIVEPIQGIENYLRLASKYGISRMTIGNVSFEFFNRVDKKPKPVTMTDIQGDVPITGMPSDEEMLYWSSGPIVEEEQKVG